MTGPRQHKEVCGGGTGEETAATQQGRERQGTTKKRYDICGEHSRRK